MDEELEQIGIRAPVGMKARIQAHVGYGKKYRDMTDFVLAAIDEKLDPSQRKEELKKEILELLKDPEARRELAALGLTGKK